ncbi:protein TUNAR isoform X3 [Dipodomys merriami]|uniref:protein TUNAR isoform X3 n=1 Tax=Dipodomys merriami TaxID=94247 RepID=UPI003855AC83
MLFSRLRFILTTCCQICSFPKRLRNKPSITLKKVSLARKIKTFATKMVITSGNDEDRGGQEKESKEESVLAMLGIIGTILNLIVIIFVYIYTTL